MRRLELGRRRQLLEVVAVAVLGPAVVSVDGALGGFIALTVYCYAAARLPRPHTHAWLLAGGTAYLAWLDARSWSPHRGTNWPYVTVVLGLVAAWRLPRVAERRGQRQLRRRQLAHDLGVDVRSPTTVTMLGRLDDDDAPIDPHRLATPRLRRHHRPRRHR